MSHGSDGLRSCEHRAQLFTNLRNVAAALAHASKVGACCGAIFIGQREVRNHIGPVAGARKRLTIFVQVEFKKAHRWQRTSRAIPYGVVPVVAGLTPASTDIDNQAPAFARSERQLLFDVRRHFLARDGSCPQLRALCDDLSWGRRLACLFAACCAAKRQSCKDGERATHLNRLSYAL